MNTSVASVSIKLWQARLSPILLIALCGLLGGCAVGDVIAEALRPLADTCTQSTFTVVTTARDDSNEGYCDGRHQCTLRRALRTANFCSYEGVKTVRFDLDAGDDTFLLYVAPPDDPLVSGAHRSRAGDVGLPRITGRVIIEGGGITVMRATDAPRFRLLHVVPDASLTLKDVTLRNGRVSDADAPPPGEEPRQTTYGGAIYNAGRTVVSSSEIRGNEARLGGGAYNEGNLTVIDSELSFNNANYGSAIFNAPEATSTLLRSRVTRNRNRWGAVATEGTLHMEQSTVDNNAGVYAGGLWIGSQLDGPASTTIFNSTLSGNSGQTGAVWCEDPGRAPGLLELRDVTIAFNRAMDAGWIGWETVGGIQVHCDNVVVLNAIVAANEPRDCGSRDRLIVGATSLDSDGDCSGFTRHADPLLGSLRDYGGPTPTHLPESGSPVIDAGDSCSPIDQRGVARSDSRCDIGSVEIP